MAKHTAETVPNLLLKNVPLALVLAIEDALATGARRAFVAARGMDEGHMPHVVGQMRHFHMNEAFQRALSANDAFPSPIQGNGVVTGRAGIFSVARFNISGGVWNNGRRSATRRAMALANEAIEPLVQPGLFARFEPPSVAVAFFVACFSKSLKFDPETPMSIEIAVPDRHMYGWLFKEPIGVFVERYLQSHSTQNDLAIPSLKSGIGGQKKQDGEAKP